MTVGQPVWVPNVQVHSRRRWQACWGYNSPETCVGLGAWYWQCRWCRWKRASDENHWKLFGMLETLWDIEYLLWIVNISRSVPCIISNISVTCLLLIARKERKHVVVQPWLWRLSWTKSYLKHHDNSSKEAQYIQALYWPTWRTGCTDHWRYTVRR